MLPADHGRVLVEEVQQTVSAQRRLQNRVAQRKFRERKARNAKAPNKRLSLRVDPHQETTPTQLFSPTQQGNREFNYSMENFPIAEYDQLISARSSEAPSANTEGHQMTQFPSSNRYGPTDMASETMNMYAYSGSFPPPISNINVQSFGGSIGVHHTTLWPPQEHSQGQEPPQTNLTFSQSNFSRMTSPWINREVSPASTNSSKQYHPVARPQSACITTPLQHRHGIGSTTRTSSEESDFETPDPPLLHVAIRSRSRDVIRVLLRRGVVNIDDCDAEGRTALHLAAELGDEALVSLLLGQRADSQLRDNRGRLAVYYAVEKGHHEVVELLIDA
ncbi:uncharacterized protein M421DRAFT_96846 [Didymella exigua CBS 183.55]|uniref:BZIP domain-containing protein n=1 Tax=Didymella exigua CBS 183.55 TaxID=1150837 RepID=A0A6A5R558_9PLEO|nr:uncharacterized protein M421DRAFT_96846 [Didymella exigua CBS 183.55]KAF1922288.1 hypothetical protein M421DRAFT_96846 [Didymella exigua CBS 183.55]